MVEVRLVDDRFERISCDLIHDGRNQPEVYVSSAETASVKLDCIDGARQEVPTSSGRFHSGYIHSPEGGTMAFTSNIASAPMDGFDLLAVTFEFAYVPVEFAPGGCGPVTSYLVDSLELSTGIAPHRGARFACGDHPLISKDLAGDHTITVTGQVSIDGTVRACYRGTAAARPGVPVVIPFDPAPEDAEACATLTTPTCAADETCGNGLDDECDGAIDDGCACDAGAVAACFSGAADERGVGACRDGTMTCGAAGWGACEGEVAPEAERCDGLDNDCDGETDEGLGCTPTLVCPASDTLAQGQPFAPYLLDGGAWIDPALVASWRWTVEGGPCDRLLFETSGQTSYTLGPTTGRALMFTPTLSGDYTVTLTVVTTSGETITCTVVIHVGGPGLRVELCWATSGADDLDLHLHRPGTTTPWAVVPPASGDVCSWMNCVPSPSATRVNWGLAPSPLASCGGAAGPWSSVGNCPNPRLDVDNTNTAGRPENINVDAPGAATYRVAAHFFRHGVTATPAAPMVNVYCRGRRVATYGGQAEPVSGFVGNSEPRNGALWRVADITTDATGDCTVAPLHPPGETTGYRVTVGGDLTY